jgi:phenylacetic acid degradation protein
MLTNKLKLNSANFIFFLFSKIYSLLLRKFNCMIYSFKGFIPVVHPSSFVHSQASVTGNVIIGKNVYIGPGAAIRGDWGGIVIADGCNVQENCTIHMFPGVTVMLDEGAHIGHGAIIHGAHIGANCLIGMNSVIMDDVVIEAECIVGALSFVAAKSHFAKRSLIVGNPAKVIKEVNDDMINWKTKGTALYQALPNEMKQYWQPCEPLTEMPASRPTQESLYSTWHSIKGS